MNPNTESQSRVKYALASFIGIVVFVIIYKYSLNLLGATSLNDLREHTAHAENIYLNTLAESWLERPYLFWHLCVKGCIKFLGMPTIESSALVCASFALFTHFVTFYLIDRTTYKMTGKDAGLMAAGVAGMLGLVEPLYIHWFNAYQYEGQFSINPIFNPTHMAVKPFGLICVMLAVDLIRHMKGQETWYFKGFKAIKGHYIMFSGILLMSAFTKPTFMYMLLPAGVIYVLIELAIALVHKDGSWKKVWDFMWKIACACIPSLVYLLVEYAAFYMWGGTDSDAQVAIYPFLEAWHIFSPNVPKSILLAMSFPIWMCITNWKYFLQSVEGRLSVISYLVGVLEFSFLVETGVKFSHLNFAWCLMSGMLVFWVVSAARLVTMTTSSKPSKWNNISICFGWILLSIYLFSGLYYINPYMYII